MDSVAIETRLNSMAGSPSDLSQIAGEKEGAAHDTVLTPPIERLFTTLEPLQLAGPCVLPARAGAVCHGFVPEPA